MKISCLPLTLFLVVIISSSLPGESLHGKGDNACLDFLQCLSLHLQNNSNGISNLIYRPNESSYFSVLRASIRNLRFVSAPNANPQVIVAPESESQIPSIVLCARHNGLQIRTRSGGHDYEGLSYTSEIPFIVLDLFKLNDITIDVERKTAWVQTGATNGQVYYALSRKSKTLAFPLGGCPTVGVGGLFSGGGYGALLRKYGLAADNIIDARMVDANGRMLDRKAMGEDVFWAIRGGGAASFGVITAWKAGLVTVPETLTVFSVSRTLEQNATMLVHKWQHVAPFTSHDIMMALDAVPIYSSENGKKTVQVIFSSLFLGRVNQLLELLNNSFPELGVRREDCNEVSYLQSALFYGGYSIHQAPEILMSRNPKIPSAIRATRFSFKAKLDYVQKPMPKYAIEGMLKLLLKREPDTAELLFVPYGGRMSEIPETATPFPHRAGNLYKIQQLGLWNHSELSEMSISWVRGMNRYLTPYVSMSPRTTYLNYRDLDIGENNIGNTSYAQASVWGLKYFEINFKRLAHVKTMIDPNNYFRNEQSIPILNSE